MKKLQKVIACFLCLLMVVGSPSIRTFAASEVDSSDTATVTDAEEEAENDVVLNKNTTEELTENPVEASTEETTNDIANEEGSLEKISTFTSNYEGVDVSGLDFSSCELLIGTSDSSIFTWDTTVLSSYDNIYLTSYNSAEEAESAYTYYYDKAEIVEVNSAFSVATVTDADDTADLASLNQGNDAISELVNTSISSVSTNTIAMLDTGVNGDCDKVSLLGDDGSDSNGHGTKMLGYIRDENPYAEVLSIKIFDGNGRANVSDLYAGIKYAIESNVKYINLSAVSVRSSDSQIIDEVIGEAIDKGIIVIVSAGNYSNNASYYSPSNITNAYVIGACEENGTRVSSSNYGSSVDYNVVSKSTSEAAARFTGYISKNGITNISSVLNKGLIFETTYTASNSSEESIESNANKTITPNSSDSIYYQKLDRPESTEYKTQAFDVYYDVTVTTHGDFTGKKLNLGSEWWSASIAGGITNTDGFEWVEKAVCRDPGKHLPSDGYSTGGSDVYYSWTSNVGFTVIDGGDGYLYYTSDWIECPSYTYANGYQRTWIEFKIPSPKAAWMTVQKTVANGLSTDGIKYALTDYYETEYAILTLGADGKTKNIELTSAGVNSGLSINTEGGWYVEDPGNAVNVNNGETIQNSNMWVVELPKSRWNDGAGKSNYYCNPNWSNSFRFIANYTNYIKTSNTPIRTDSATYGSGSSYDYTKSGKNSDGKDIYIAYKKSGESVYTVGSYATVDAPIIPIKGTLAIKKTAKGSNNAEPDANGIVYKLYKTKSDASNSTNSIANITIGSDGYGIVRNLDAGTYYLREYSIPTGIQSKYALSSEITSVSIKNASARYFSFDENADGTANVKVWDSIFSFDSYKGTSKNEATAFTTFMNSASKSDLTAKYAFENANSYETVTGVTVSDDYYLYVYLRKSVATGYEDYVKNNPNYSLTNTTYGLYKSETDAIADSGRLGTFTVGGNGNSNTLKFKSSDIIASGELNSKLFVKELSAGKGYSLNSSIVPLIIRITNNSTENAAVVNVSDIPKTDPIDIELNKVDQSGNVLSVPESATLSGAEYTFNYYKLDVNNTYTASQLASMTPDWSAVFKTLKDGNKYIVKMHDSYKVSGNDAYEKDLNGKYMFPFGYMTVQETKAPEGYNLSGGTFYLNDKAVNGNTAVFKVNGGAKLVSGNTIKTITQYEVPIRGDLKLNKVDENGEPLKNVKFKIENIQNGEVHYIYTDDNGYAATNKVSHSLNTNYYDTKEFDSIVGNNQGVWFDGTSSGNNSTPIDSQGALPYGTYKVTEMRCTANFGMQLQPTITVDIDTNGSVVNVTDLNSGETNITNMNNPYLESDARCVETDSEVVPPFENQSIEDVVKIHHIRSNTTYTLVEKLMVVDKDGNVSPFMYVDSNEITSTFKTPSTYTKSTFNIDSTQTVLFTGVDGTKIPNGSKLVVYSRLYLGDSADETKEYTADEDIFPVLHEDPTELRQTLVVPNIRTTASDKDTGKNVANADDKVTIIDTVSYTNLSTDGREYKIEGKLMVKSTGKPLLVDGKEVTSSKTFVPSSRDGYETLEFTFNAEALKGESVVCFEYLKYKDIEIGYHTSLSDENQTVSFPLIFTTVKDPDDNDKILAPDGNYKLTDTVTFKNLPIGTYTIKGVLMDQDTNKEFLIGGKTITGSTTFTNTETDGSVDVEFEFSTDITGKYLVVFEELYTDKADGSGSELVAKHTDIDDQGQTIKIASYGVLELTSTRSPSSRFGVRTGDKPGPIIAFFMCLGGLIGAIYVVSKKKKRKKVNE